MLQLGDTSEARSATSQCLMISIQVLRGSGMDLRYLYTSFDGRINRKPFWIDNLILSLAFLYPSAALGVTRLHDRSKPSFLTLT